MRQLQWLGECLRGRRAWFFFAMFLAVLSAALYVTFPFLTQCITDTVLASEGAVSEIGSYIITLLVLLLGAQLLRTLVRGGMTAILEVVSQNMQMNIRTKLYETLHKQDSVFYMRYRTGDLMTRLTGDLDLVRHTISWISYQSVESLALFVFSLAYLWYVNVSLTALLLIFVPIILIGSFRYCRSVYPLYGNLHDKLTRMNSMVQENIEGNKTVRAFAREPYETEKFSKANEAFREANLNANKRWIRFYPMVEIISQSMGFVVLIVGGLMIMQDKLSFGELAAFTLLTRGFSDPMRNMGMYLNDFQRFLASATKVMEIYYSRPSVESPEKGATQSAQSGTVTFDQVSVRYPGQRKYALKDVSFSVEPGKTIAILGATGSGKTTLVETLTRMLDVESGAVRVDGIDVRKWNLQALRSRISVATQRVQLHSDTIAANVSYSNPEMKPEQVEAYIRFAEAQFTEELPQGLQTIIGEQGTGLSGGQKQRVALARAMAKEAEILVLDDVTSAVDLGTERRLCENMGNLPTACTKIIVAQRISSMRHADCIYVLDHGEIVQRGTHAELSAQEGIYRRFCKMQGVTL